MSYFALGAKRVSQAIAGVQHALLTIRIAVAEPQGTHFLICSQKGWLSVFSLGLVIKVL